MLSHHLDDCEKYTFECQFCGLEGTKQFLIKKHRCYQMHLGNNKDGKAYHFNKNRITNKKSLKNIYNQLKCD